MSRHNYKNILESATWHRSTEIAIRIGYQGGHSWPAATAVVYVQIPMTVNSPTVGESSFRLNYHQPASHSISQALIDSRYSNPLSGSRFVARGDHTRASCLVILLGIPPQAFIDSRYSNPLSSSQFVARDNRCNIWSDSYDCQFADCRGIFFQIKLPSTCFPFNSSSLNSSSFNFSSIH